MSSDKYIIKSKLTLKKYPYDSLIELLIERLKTDQDKGCIVREYLLLIFELDCFVPNSDRLFTEQEMD